MKENTQHKTINKAAKNAIKKKYKWETRLFIIALFMVCYIEFMSFLHCPSVWNFETCLKINNLTSQLLLAYIASYVFLYLNILNKERKAYENYYPQIIQILRNLFGVFDSHEKHLKSIYKVANKGKSFTYNSESIRTVIKYLEAREKIYIESYGNQIDNQYTPAKNITGSNYLTAGQISYDIELLETFNNVLDSEFKITLFSISQNLFILKLKDKQINNLKYYDLLVDEEIMLYKEIQKLREQSVILFDQKF